MLIVSSNLTLLPEETFAPGVPLILWNSIVSTSNLAADSEADNYPATNLVNPSTLEEWRATAAADVEISITTGSADDLDGVGIARHNFGSQGIGVEVGYYDESDAWVSLAGPQVPPNDEPLLFHFTAQPLAIVVVKLAAGAAAPRAAVLYVGKMLVCERGFDVGPEFKAPRFARKTVLTTGRSVRGDYLGRVAEAQWIAGAEFTFSHLRPDWYRTHFDPFISAAQKDVPFFLAWSPVDYPSEVTFCWFNDDPVPMTSPVTGRKKIVLSIDGITV